MVSALIVRKPTNLEQHQSLEAKRLVSQRIDSNYRLFIEASHREHYECLDSLRGVLQDAKVSFDEITTGAEQPTKKYDFVIAFGGDGTLITSSYYIDDDTPLLGIRSSSASVGFLCAGDHSNLHNLIHACLNRSLEYVPRHRLKANILRRDGKVEVSEIAALNDMLFAAESPAATTRYQICFLNRIENHKSSGIWIATATGSTAAIGAAGGAMMAPGDSHFQFLVRELYQRREEGLLLHQGYSDPAKDKFWIESRCPKSILALDGEKLIIPIEFGDKIYFTLANPVKVALKAI